MSQQRKYKLSQLWTAVEVSGIMVQMYQFNDLSDQDLQAQHEYYFEREDYEYLAQIKAEADSRNIILKNPKKKRSMYDPGLTPYNAECDTSTGKRVAKELDPISPFELDVALLQTIQGIGLMPYLDEAGKTYYLIEPDGVIWGTTDPSRKPGASDFYYDPNLPFI